MLGAQPISDLDRTSLLCQGCKRIRTATCCTDAHTQGQPEGSESSFLQPTSAADDCPACGQPLTAQGVFEKAPALSVGKRTGRVLRPPSKPGPAAGDAVESDDCAECRQWKTRHRQLLTIRRSLELPKPASLTPDRLIGEAAYGCMHVTAPALAPDPPHKGEPPC